MDILFGIIVGTALSMAFVKGTFWWADREKERKARDVLVSVAKADARVAMDEAVRLRSSLYSAIARIDKLEALCSKSSPSSS